MSLTHVFDATVDQADNADEATTNIPSFSRSELVVRSTKSPMQTGM